MRKKIEIFYMGVKTQNSVLIANPLEKAGKKFTRKKFYHNSEGIWQFFRFELCAKVLDPVTFSSNFCNFSKGYEISVS
jgi:hypothetical protein